MIKSGIYKIINKINEKYYVGSSTDINRRWRRHKNKLNKNIHSNSHLQNSWNKYGKNNFSFIVIEKILDKSKLLNREQYYLDECKNNPITNYNISYDASAPMQGRKHSDICRQKMRERYKTIPHPLLGTHLSNETKQKIGEANSKRIWSNISKQKISNIHKGKVLSEKQKEKIATSNRGKFVPQSTCLKISNSKKGTMMGINNPRFGKHHTDLAKEKLSLSHQDQTTFIFKNIKTNEIFNGISYDFSKKFGLLPNSTRTLVTGRIKSLKGWMINTNTIL